MKQMKKIGLFYGSATSKTVAVAKKIQEAFGGQAVDIISVENTGKKEVEAYEHIIAGTSTWFDGELPTYWDELLPDLDSMNLKGKKVAVFGLGDQAKYPDNFVDGIGILGEIFEQKGATLVGFTSTEGYHFDKSAAVRDGKFMGLALDMENQQSKTEERITKWVEQLKKEF